MAGTAASLFWIALCAVAAPILAALVPRRLIPEVVLLLGLGVLTALAVLVWRPSAKASKHFGSWDSECCSCSQDTKSS
jgi:hypothetical protein